jgi:hypothetical protein
MSYTVNSAKFYFGKNMPIFLKCIGFSDFDTPDKCSLVPGLALVFFMWITMCHMFISGLTVYQSVCHRSYSVPPTPYSVTKRVSHVHQQSLQCTGRCGTCASADSVTERVSHVYQQGLQCTGTCVTCVSAGLTVYRSVWHMCISRAYSVPGHVSHVHQQGLQCTRACVTCASAGLTVSPCWCTCDTASGTL